MLVSIIRTKTIVFGLWIKEEVSIQFTSLVTRFLIFIDLLEFRATGCGQAKVQSSDISMVFPSGWRIETTYGCTPKFGAGKTLKLLVKSASESCKLQLVSSVLDNILKQGIQILFFRLMP